MKRRISALVLAFAMLLSVVPTAAATETDDGFVTLTAPNTTVAPAEPEGAFSDTEGTYYEEAAQRWADAGVLNGVGDNLFAGGNTAKRGEAAKVIVLTAGMAVKDPSADFFTEFTDVPQDAWYAPYIYTLWLAGIMQGDGNGKMRPEDQLTREEYVTLKGRAFGITENKSALRYSSLSGKDEVADWAAGYMGAFIAAGIIKGDENGYINAKGSIVRGEMAVISDRLITEYISEGGTYTVSGTGVAVIATSEDVTVKGTFDGSVIVGDKAGSVTADFYDLRGITVNGGSVTVKGQADMVTANGGAKVTVAEGASVTAAVANGENAYLEINGTVDSIGVDSSTLKIGVSGTVDTVSISGEGSDVTVTGVVSLIADDKTASDTTINADIGAEIASVSANGAGVTVSGWGSVGSVTANGSDISVSTFGTTVTAGTNATNVTANGGEVTAGSATVLPGSAPTVDRPVITPDPTPAAFKTNPVGGSTKYYGKELTLSVEVLEDKNHGYTYQWFVSTSEDYTHGVAVSGAISSKLVISPTDSTKLDQTFYYYCQVTSYLNDKTAVSNSEIAPVTVKDEALNIFAFGEHILGSFYMINTFRDMLTEKGIKYNMTTDYCGHTSTSGSWNAYELFDSSARSDLSNYTFGSGSTAQNFKKKLESTAFDYVIIDTGKTVPLMWSGDARNNNYSIRKIAKLAADMNPDCQVILLAPYANTVGLAKDFSAGTMNTHVDTYYEHVAAINVQAEQAKADIDADGDLNKPAKIVYASNAFSNYSTDLAKIADDLYRPTNGKTNSSGYSRGWDNGNRASALGSYMVACLLYEAVTEQSPIGLTYLGYSKGNLASADETDDVLETKADLERLDMTAEEAALMIQQYVSARYVTYKVEYYLQNADGETYTLDHTETLLGKADGSFFYADAKYIDGYMENASHADSYRTGLLENDGSTVFKIYYDRQLYAVTYGYSNYYNNHSKPNPPATQYYMWGSTVSVEADPVWEGYSFGGWTSFDAEITDGTFTMPLGGAEITGKWSKTGVENPVVEVDATTAVDGFTNEGMANSIRYEEETIKGYLEFASDLTSAGLAEDEHNAAVLKLSKLIPNSKFSLTGLYNGEPETREFTASAEGTAEVLWGFEEGEDSLTVYVYDEDDEIAAELIVGVDLDLYADINIYMFASFSGQASDTLKTLDLMLEEKLGTTVEITYPSLGKWNSYNVWELFSLSDSNEVTGISNSILKNIFNGTNTKTYDYFVFQTSNDYVGFKGKRHTQENNVLAYVQDKIAEYNPDAEMIVYVPYAIRQGFGDGNTLWKYLFKPEDFPGLKSETNIYFNSRENVADILQMRAGVIMGLLEAKDSYSITNTRVANVADAFEYYINNEGEENDLYSAEEGLRNTAGFSALRNLANANGAYLNAAVLASVITGETVLDIETLGAETATVAADKAELFLQIADMYAGGKPQTSAAQLTYDAETGAVTAAEGVGEVTVRFNGATGVPTRVGTYTVTADVAGGTAYGYAKGIWLGEFVVEGDGLGATIALAPNALNAGLTGGEAIDAGKTMTLDGTLRYNGQKNSHTVELIATGPVGAMVIGQSDAGVGFATVGEDGTAIISVPVTPDKDTVKVTVSNETAVDTFTVKVADTAELTINIMFLGDGYATGAAMNAHKWMRDILTEAGYTPTIRASYTTAGNFGWHEIFNFPSRNNSTEPSSISGGKGDVRSALFNAIMNNTEYSSVDYGTFKFDYAIVSVDRRYAMNTANTNYNEQFAAVKYIEDMMYAHNPDAEIILVSPYGSSNSSDTGFGTVAEQVTKAENIAVKLKETLEAYGNDMPVTLIKYGSAMVKMAGLETSMASNSDSSYTLAVNNYSETNKRNLGPAGAAILQYMLTEFMVDIDIWEVAYPWSYNSKGNVAYGFKKDDESANAWSIHSSVLPIAQYWASSLDEYIVK